MAVAAPPRPRCIYCGQPCKTLVCGAHLDLLPKDPQLHVVRERLA